MTARVLLQIADGVAAIVLNRPESGNAIDRELARELMLATHACEKDRGVRAVVLRGNGRLFCAGGDLKAIQGEGNAAAAYVRELLAYLHEALSAMARIPVPVIAGIHGAAAGAGFSLACATDLAVATRSARFVMAYATVGLTPDGSSSWYLPRLVGLRRALQLSLLNRELTAEEAFGWGLLNEIVDDDALPEAVTALARRLASGPTAAHGGAKRLLRMSLDNTLETQLMEEMRTICAALDGGEAREGLAAFIAKRPANFR
ncbi:MAG: enoyl-CoA hydratase-related protein [Rhizomicrobium sp.]